VDRRKILSIRAPAREPYVLGVRRQYHAPLASAMVSASPACSILNTGESSTPQI
jgi:hypothetical protein